MNVLVGVGVLVLVTALKMHRCDSRRAGTHATYVIPDATHRQDWKCLGGSGHSAVPSPDGWPGVSAVGFRRAARSCRRRAGVGCRAGGWSTSPCRDGLEPVALVAFGGRGSEVDVGRAVGVGLDGAGLAAETGQVLVGLQHRAGLVVVHQQRPEPALGDVGWKREAVVAGAVEVVPFAVAHRDRCTASRCR